MTTMLEARDAYFERNGLSAETYTERWAKVDVFGVPLLIPNSPSRARSLRVHDLHHVLTGYATNTIGEGEIGAWELGSGPKDHYVAWILDTATAAVASFVAPRRILRAFQRGRHSKNLYGLSEGAVAAVLEQPVDQVRLQLGLSEE